MLSDAQIKTLANVLHNTRLSLKMGVVCAGISTEEINSYEVVLNQLQKVECYQCSSCHLWRNKPAQVTPLLQLCSCCC